MTNYGEAWDKQWNRILELGDAATCPDCGSDDRDRLDGPCKDTIGEWHLVKASHAHD